MLKERRLTRGDLNKILTDTNSRQAHKERLLEKESQIRGSLKLSRWIDISTNIGFYGGFLGGLAMGAADSPEGSLASLGVAFSGLAVKFGRSWWSLNHERTIEDLDTVQKKLHTVHNIPPDQGYFDRAMARQRDRQKAMGEIARLRNRAIR